MKTLFTKDHFREMIELDEFILNIKPPKEMLDELG